MKKIIVIGAGIAGLKAALDLALKHFDVTLIEARERLGGRIYTVQASDNKTPIELGASYWEGYEANPFYQQYFTTSKTDLIKPFTQVFQEQQSTIIDLAAARRCLASWEIQKYYQLARQYIENTSQSREGKTCQQMIADCDFKESDAEVYWIKKIMAVQFIHQSTALSLMGFPKFKIPSDPEQLNACDEAGANFCFVGNGYFRVVQQLADACVGAGVKIITNTPVHKIIDNNDNVTIQTANQVFYANKIICTIPIGVLKTNAEKLFIKPLSAEKLQAIDAMGVHESTRVVMEFENPFLKEHCPYLLLFFADKKGIKEFRNNQALHQKAILQTPSYANEAKNLNDKDLKMLILSDLRKALPASNFSLKKYWVYRWSNDPFSQGAYPYRTLKMDENKHIALARKEGNIYFAGADFSRYGFSVHHAYASAKAVARELITDLNAHLSG
ncbi:MAG: FAD-dependent oxidoreductase [Proteobacteria bacterium]|nr:FAD-dependent oxidoreductase [Pseudomonadota bacterium]